MANGTAGAARSRIEGALVQLQEISEGAINNAMQVTKAIKEVPETNCSSMPFIRHFCEGAKQPPSRLFTVFNSAFALFMAVSLLVILANYQREFFSDFEERNAGGKRMPNTQKQQVSDNSTHGEVLGESTGSGEGAAGSKPFFEVTPDPGEHDNDSSSLPHPEGELEEEVATAHGNRLKAGEGGHLDEPPVRPPSSGAASPSKRPRRSFFAPLHSSLKPRPAPPKE